MSILTICQTTFFLPQASFFGTGVFLQYNDVLQEGLRRITEEKLQAIEKISQLEVSGCLKRNVRIVLASCIKRCSRVILSRNHTVMLRTNAVIINHFMKKLNRN
jgi:hypothetical protein